MTANLMAAAICLIRNAAIMAGIRYIVIAVIQIKLNIKYNLYKVVDYDVLLYLTR